MEGISARIALAVSLVLGGMVSTADAQARSPERPRLPLLVEPHTLAICRLPAAAPVPPWAVKPSAFQTVSRTAFELSITTLQSEVPAEIQCERDYRAIRVRGPLPLYLVGILASIAGPLAEAGLSIFAISTFDTDYVLVKSTMLDSALAVLKGAGHTVSFPTEMTPKEPFVTQHAAGTFEVKLAPQPGYHDSVGRMSLDKKFQGDLVASSVGEMLAVMSGVEGSAGYVAMERVTGSLKGRTGSFALQHNGIMTRGTPSLTVSVVPDSGTEGLAGLAGTMKIIVEGGKHSYEFDYTLPAAE